MNEKWLIASSQSTIDINNWKKRKGAVSPKKSIACRYAGIGKASYFITSPEQIFKAKTYGW